MTTRKIAAAMLLLCVCVPFRSYGEEPAKEKKGLPVGLSIGGMHGSTAETITTYTPKDGPGSVSPLPLLGGGGTNGATTSDSTKKEERKSTSEGGVVVEAIVHGGNPSDGGKRLYGNASARFEYTRRDGENVYGAAGHVMGGYQVLGAKKDGVMVHVGVEPGNLAFHADSNIVNDLKQIYVRKFAEENGYNPDSQIVKDYAARYGVQVEAPKARREHFIQWSPMASAGAEFQIKDWRIIPLVRAGASLGTLGQAGVHAAYGWGLVANSKHVDLSIDSTRIASGDRPVDVTVGDLLVKLPNFGLPVAFGAGLRAESIITHDGAKSVAPIPAPATYSPNDRVETRGLATLKVVF